MKTKNLIPTLMLTLSSCTSPGYYKSTEVVKAPASLSRLVASDLAEAMKQKFPPAGTTIHFPHEGGELSRRLETSLRASGFAVITDPKSAGKANLRFAYVLDSLDQRHYVLKFVAGETFQATQIYEQALNGHYRPAGPLLIREEGR